MTNLMIIFVVLISIFLIPISAFSQGPLDEMTDEDAKFLREAREQFAREDQLNAELSVLIPIIIGLVFVGVVIGVLKRKKK